MENHLQEVLYAIGTILPIIAFMWKMRKDISNEIDNKIDALERRIDKRFDAIDKRFDAIDERLARIEQNHIDHLMQLHVIPSSTDKSIAAD